jgi:hypothetical protein
MEGKRTLSDAEVDVAVDSLMTSLGLPEGGASASTQATRFETEAAKPKLKDPENLGGAPSGDVAALWGAPKPRKK